MSTRQGSGRARHGQPRQQVAALDGQAAAALAVPQHDLRTIEGIVADLADRQALLTAYLEQVLADDGNIGEVAKVFALHGQNASRLGRLLRDQRALSGESADSLLAAIGKALDEISTELGIEL